MKLSWSGVVAGVIAVVAACSEQFPRSFDEGADDPGATTPDASPLDGGTADGDTEDASVADASPDATEPCTDIDSGVPAVELAPVTTEPLTAPVETVEHAGTLHVLEQGGRVLRVNPDGTLAVMLDLSAKIVAGGEAGLLGMAFHPSFAANGYVYFYYTAPYPQSPPPAGFVFRSMLVRYRSTDAGLTLDPASEHVVLVVDQPYSNHNGGTIEFGNDGFLYWGLGDGGSGGDPRGHAQNPRSLLGKMLRLDVDGAEPYAIPPSNPFADGVAGAREIFATGLRNPYRWRFDRPSGDLWAGDVGQGAREEIDRVVLGGNYGWNVREGKACYNAATCATEGFIEPVVEHGRAEATAITGGVVYRASGIPALTGHYVYGDFGRKAYYAFLPTDAAPTPNKILAAAGSVLPAAFSLDAQGEIIVTDYRGGLYRMVEAKRCF